MKCKRMSFEQIERMVARQDGYDDFNEWMEDTPLEERDSIHDLVSVFNIVYVDGVKGYVFQDEHDVWCIWLKY